MTPSQRFQDDLPVAQDWGIRVYSRLSLLDTGTKQRARLVRKLIESFPTAETTAGGCDWLINSRHEAFLDNPTCWWRRVTDDEKQKSWLAVVIAEDSDYFFSI